MVRVSVFDRAGQLVGPVESSKFELSDTEWRQRLTPEQFEVSRGKGTERPFCGTLLDNKQSGVYSCIGCGLPLFASDSKFNSGTGWPSFFRPIADGNVAEHTDRSHGMSRVEILCARCDGHLGHVFEDGPRPTGLRYCLNSASLKFTKNEDLASLADPLAEQRTTGGTSRRTTLSAKTGTAVLAGGCFWCTEAAFDQIAGVLDVESGYTGGSKETADYEQVCSGRTGHAEAIRITYDPQQVSFSQLLDVFFVAHNPTQLNQQGADVGTQYRSAIFFANDEERQIAETRIRQLNDAKAFPRPIVTSLEPLTEFYAAEEYHQDFASNNPRHPYIQAVSIPKVCHVREAFPKILKPDH